jgi:AcrR family transcriptional regulator
MKASSTFQQLDKRKQNRILSAALSEFSHRGYAGASINTIVEKVGIAKGSIFNYFSDKEGLFVFVFQQSLERVKDHLRKVLVDTADDDLFTRIEKSLLAGVDFIRAHPRIFRIYLRVHYERSLRPREDLIKSVRRYSMKFLSNLLSTAQSRGEIPPKLDVPKAAFVLDAVLERFLQAYGVQHLDADLGIFKASEKDIRDWAGGIVSILRTGLERTKDS